MIQIIDGKRYNTETAELVGEWDNGLGYNDFNNCSEELYITKKGAFFLSGEGGAMSRWSQPCGNMTGGGSGMKLLSKTEALGWCESHLQPDEYEEYFEIEEG